MPQFDLKAGIGRSRDVADSLHREWEEALQHWSDDNSRVIEEDHLRPLFQELSNAMNAIQRLAELVDNAQRECEPDEFFS